MTAYQHDMEMLPDSAFHRGELKHLVAGNEGRMLDPRRTPIRVLDVNPDNGFFECEVLAFEDHGARWFLPFESVGTFQFGLQSHTLQSIEVRELETVVERFDQTIAVGCEPERRHRTELRLDHHRSEASAWLAARSSFFASGGRLDFGKRTGDPRLRQDVEAFLDSCGLADMELAFSQQFVSNPGSGELIKGHRIVLAELGLVPYEGKVVRDRETFAGAFTRELRAEHILWRMAFVQATYARAGYERVIVYRGISTDGSLQPPINRTFVSTSFDPAIAMELYAPSTNLPRTGALYRQAVPVSRLFMTYQETAALNARYQEAEAVLLVEPGNLAF